MTSYFSIFLGELLREEGVVTSFPHCSLFGLNYLVYIQPSGFRLLMLLAFHCVDIVLVERSFQDP